MKKIFTLAAAAVMALGVSAQDSFMVGMGNSTQDTKTCLNPAGEEVTDCDGLVWNIDGVGTVTMYLTTSGKAYSGGNSSALNAEFGKPIKLSNGAPNLITLPEGWTTDKVELYGYCNTAGSTSNFTILSTSGEAISETSENIESITKDDFGSMTLDQMNKATVTLTTPVNQFYLKNGGKQPAVYIKIYKASGEVNPEPGLTPLNPEGETELDLIGQYYDFPTNYGKVKADVNLDADTKTLTFKNFLGCGTNVTVTYEQRDQAAPANIGVISNLIAGEGLILAENAAMSGTYDVAALKDRCLLMKTEENNIRVSNIQINLSTYSSLEQMNLAQTSYKLALYLVCKMEKWDAATNDWVLPTDYKGAPKEMWFMQLEGIVGEPLPESAIEAIVSDVNENAPVEYFNIQGMRINEPAAGQIVIRRQGNNVTKFIAR